MAFTWFMSIIMHFWLIIPFRTRSAWLPRHAAQVFHDRARDRNALARALLKGPVASLAGHEDLENGGIARQALQDAHEPVHFLPEGGEVGEPRDVDGQGEGVLLVALPTRRSVEVV